MKKKTAAKPLNVAQKIIAAHLVEGDPAKDAELGIRIDQTLTQDATGTMAYLQFESMDVPHVRNELAGDEMGGKQLVGEVHGAGV